MRWVHRRLHQSIVKPALPSNESYENKRGCKSTLATVLCVPLICLDQFVRDIARLGTFLSDLED